MYISNTDYTSTGFTQNRANTTIGGSRPWVAFGKQKQWGQARAIGSVRTKEFAITFPSECNIAMALPWKDDGLAYQINIQSVELSSFKYYYHTAVTEVEICYIAFGV